MKNERDILVKNVFPKLKDYCKIEYNLEFQVIDMRWGIESSLLDLMCLYALSVSSSIFLILLNLIGFSNKSNLSGQFCIDEVRTCNEISAKPCFIVRIS